MKVVITYSFCCDNFWKSVVLALEKPGKLGGIFFLLCGHLEKFVFGRLLGKIGITLDINHAEPKDRDNPDDVEAAERAQQMKAGWFCNAIFGNGDYPDIMKAQLAKVAKTLGLDRSPLPQFTDEEKRYNRGRLDEIACVLCRDLVWVQRHWCVQGQCQHQ